MTHSQLCRQSLSKHFVEVPLKMPYSDKVFRQRIPTKTLRHGLWDRLEIQLSRQIPQAFVASSLLFCRVKLAGSRSTACDLNLLCIFPVTTTGIFFYSL